MFQKFKTKELVICGLFGGLAVAVGVFFGILLVEIFGIGMAFINSLLVGTVFALGMLLVNKFGTATIIATIYGVLISPLPLIGPPGIHKVAVGIILGFLVDCIYYLLRKHPRIGLPISFGVGAGVVPWVILFFVIWLGLPGGKLVELTPILSVASFILGAIGAYLGLWLFDKKLKDKAFIKQIQG